jgi:hypothetical protein
VPPNWIHGFTRVDLGPSGGIFDETSHPKGCLHTTEGSTIAGAESAYRNYPPHIGYDPTRRVKHQYVPLNRHSYAFKGSESDDEYVIQIEIVGFARQTHLWSQTIYNRIAEDVMKPLEELVGIPQRSLRFYGEGDGIVLASPDSPIRLSPGALRNYRGWLGHQHIPSPDAHWDPGKFQIQKAFAHLKSLEPAPPLNREDSFNMIDFIRGDSKVEDANGTPYGFRVFKVNYADNTSQWVNSSTPELLAQYKLWQAAGGQTSVVPQEVLDSYNQEVS